MLFNSYQFLLIFFPITLAGFALLGRYGNRAWSLQWLIAASIVFYGIWNPANLLIIAPSVLANYALARAIEERVRIRPATSRALLIAGIIGNVLFLSYFKYRNFFLEVGNDLVGAGYVMTELVLPLGISFITFQKIAFLIDVYYGRTKSFTFREYLLFVLFFPQLIAGPIVHYREVMPQFEKSSGRVAAADLAVGTGLFFFGLFKKVVLADGIAPFVSPIYTAAAEGTPISAVYAWIAAVGFIVQVYFDFSGYSDMALGLARIFGIRLPMNFNSPLKATNIISFWASWHITLTRFLIDYVYNPLALSIARRRILGKQSVVAGSKTTLGAFLIMIALPTFVTMVLCGIWHGAGYQFVLFGFVHGCYLAVNHAWRLMRPRFWRDTPSYERAARPFGFALTFVAVVFAVVLFRAPSVAAAVPILKGMIGLNGVAIPMAIGSRLGEWLPTWMVLEYSSGKVFAQSLAWLGALLGIAWLMPNSLQIMAHYHPALEFVPSTTSSAAEPLGLQRRPWPRIQWRISGIWAVATALVASAGFLALDQPTQFLYWQF